MDDINKAYQEVNYILSKAPEELKEKISPKVLNQIDLRRDRNYEVNFDMSKPLGSQNLLDSTKSILSMMYYDYWCKDEEEKKNLAGKFYLNNDLMK